MNDIVDFKKNKQNKKDENLEHTLIIKKYKDNYTIHIDSSSVLSDVEAIRLLQDAISGIMATWEDEL